MKIGIVISDGVGYRNFVYSNFLSEVLSKFDSVKIYSYLPANAFVNINQNIEIIELDLLNESRLIWFFRKMKEVTHLSKNKLKNFGIFDNYTLNKISSYSLRALVVRFIFLWASLFKSEWWIKFWTQCQMFSLSFAPVTKKYIDILKKDKPDVLFFTHQRPPFIAPMIWAASTCKIPSVAFIFSWDNIPSKNRMAGDFDYFLVWSKLMKSELMEFYNRVVNSQIFIVGTPQFEPYVLESFKIDKSDFFQGYAFDGIKKIICYSCGDISTSPNDEFYIETIAQAILEDAIKESVYFVVRSSPAETPARYVQLEKKYSWICWNHPKWICSRESHSEPWTQRIPLKEDVFDLRSLLEYTDVNINMCSTMSLDFMQFDKPVINAVFGNGQNGLYDDQRFLKYAHYKRVVDSGAVTIAKTSEELVDAINDALRFPNKQQAQRKALLELQLGKPLAEVSQTIADTLWKISFR